MKKKDILDRGKVVPYRQNKKIEHLGDIKLVNDSKLRI